MSKICLFFVALVFVACHTNSSENTIPSEPETALTSTNDSTIVIASLVDGKASFVVDTAVLRKDWKNFISNNTTNETYVLQEITLVYTGEENEHYLVASGTMNGLALKSTIQLKLEGSSCLTLSGRTIACTASGLCATYPEGCMPKETYCSKCAENDAGSQCTKTFSDSPLGLFPSLETDGCPQ